MRHILIFACRTSGGYPEVSWRQFEHLLDTIISSTCSSENIDTIYEMSPVLNRNKDQIGGGEGVTALHRCISGLEYVKRTNALLPLGFLHGISSSTFGLVEEALTVSLITLNTRTKLLVLLPKSLVLSHLGGAEEWDAAAVRVDIRIMGIAENRAAAINTSKERTKRLKDLIYKAQRREEQDTSKTSINPDIMLTKAMDVLTDFLSRIRSWQNYFGAMPWISKHGATTMELHSTDNLTDRLRLVSRLIIALFAVRSNFLLWSHRQVVMDYYVMEAHRKLSEQVSRLGKDFALPETLAPYRASFHLLVSAVEGIQLDEFLKHLEQVLSSPLFGDPLYEISLNPKHPRICLFDYVPVSKPPVVAVAANSCISKVTKVSQRIDQSLNQLWSHVKSRSN
jgi:hypothetical protein